MLSEKILGCRVCMRLGALRYPIYIYMMFKAVTHSKSFSFFTAVPTNPLLIYFFFRLPSASAKSSPHVCRHYEEYFRSLTAVSDRVESFSDDNTKHFPFAASLYFRFQCVLIHFSTFILSEEEKKCYKDKRRVLYFRISSVS